ncbi:MFS transporter [Sanguibacter sp. A247]|uniref:MFS transporter n=1 Tax=unclassified Sanguibacter TaxID=2645534 RepID=UPI003FD77BBF
MSTASRPEGVSPDEISLARATTPDSWAGTPLGAGVTRRPGRWLDGWNPENSAQWIAVGRSAARRNLAASVYAEFLGFVVWALWSVVVPLLPAAGFTLTVDQMFWLIAVPSLVGATLRIPYTFAVPVFGGRTWTTISALLLLVPLVALVVVVQDPTTSFGTLLVVAALAGVGGGNFASSMANISFFYPEAAKGRALGLNAAGGNLGTAAVQLVVPLVVVGAAGVHLERAGLLIVPLVLIAAVLAWRTMDNLTGTRSDMRSYAVAATRHHTWLISVIYVGTFGSFIGFASVFPTVLATTFPDVTVSIAFLGALVGSVARPLGGMLADRVGGARVTLVAFAVMAGGVLGAIGALRSASFTGFLGSFLVLFVATGVGNGSVYRMIPAVFRTGATDDADRAQRARIAAGCLGIAGAVGAFGGFLVPRGFASSTAATGGIEAALWVVVGAYAVLAALTWTVYARRGTRLGAAGV